MNVLIVLAHPERASFNGGLADIAKSCLQDDGHQVDIDDLYGEGFDPVERAEHYTDRVDFDYLSLLNEQRQHYARGMLSADVEREISRLEWADMVIFQFPLWWHAQPAILKGWFDRVFVYGGIYSGSRRYNRGHFQGKRALCSVTTGSPQRSFQPFGRAGNIVEWLWPIHSSLYYVGFDVIAPQISYGVQGGGIQYQDERTFRDQLEQKKVAWADRLARFQSEPLIPFTGWEDWDEDGVLKQDHPARWRP